LNLELYLFELDDNRHIVVTQITDFCRIDKQWHVSMSDGSMLEITDDQFDRLREFYFV